MFARVMSADIPSHVRDRAKIAKVLEADALPAIEKEEGFRSVTFLFDKQNGKLMSVTLFDSEPQMKQSHEGIKPIRAGVLEKLGARHLTAESFEIVATREA